MSSVFKPNLSQSSRTGKSNVKCPEHVLDPKNPLTNSQSENRPLNVCPICKNDLKIFLDHESNSCTNCGVDMAAYFSEPLFHSPQYTSSGTIVKNSSKRSHTQINALLKWGWSNPSIQSTSKRQKKARNSSFQNSVRSLDSQYLNKELNSIILSISAIARLSNFSRYLERAVFLLKSALSKRQKNGKFFKMGQEGRLVGISCLHIAVLEGGEQVQLSKFSKPAKVSTYILGAIYKKTKLHLEFVSPRTNFNKISSDILQSLLFKLKNFKSVNPINGQAYFNDTPNGKVLHQSKDSIIDGLVNTLHYFSFNSFVDLSCKLAESLFDNSVISGKNITHIIGASLIISIYSKFYSLYDTAHDIYHKYSGNLFFKLISDICVCSIDSLKNNIKLILSYLDFLVSKNSWLFGILVYDSDKILILEKILNFSSHIKNVIPDSQIGSDSQCIYSKNAPVSTLNKYTISQIDSLKSIIENPKESNSQSKTNAKIPNTRSAETISANTQSLNSILSSDIFSSSLELADIVSSGLLESDSKGKDTSDMRKKKEENIFLLDHLNSSKDVPLNKQDEIDIFIDHESSRISLDEPTPRTCLSLKIEQEADDKYVSVSRKRKVQNLEDIDEKYSFGTTFNPPSFVKSENLAKKRLNLLNESLNEEFNLSEQAKCNYGLVYSIIESEFKPAKSQYLAKIKFKLDSFYLLSNKEIIVSLFLLKFPLSSLTSLHLHTLLQTLKSLMRKSALREKDLDATFLDDTDLSASEISVYLKI
ncbi:hypothetical protein BB560_000970 [Smittium megazygosporum]|uniref:Uncharacterized protein n=1 Tax=Smittium megazygosporum TaxID=133381 RepID=A0A2T9ZIW6_9FUNG|nr:hypothetical protein BB560_000970 [Smittium megazygosporum]